MQRKQIDSSLQFYMLTECPYVFCFIQPHTLVILVLNLCLYCLTDKLYRNKQTKHRESQYGPVYLSNTGKSETKIDTKVKWDTFKNLSNTTIFHHSQPLEFLRRSSFFGDFYCSHYIELFSHNIFYNLRFVRCKKIFTQILFRFNNSG